MDQRERLLDLHKEHYGQEEEYSKEKSDMELMLDLIEHLAERLEESRDHSHTLS